MCKCVSFYNNRYTSIARISFYYSLRKKKRKRKTKTQSNYVKRTFLVLSYSLNIVSDFFDQISFFFIQFPIDKFITGIFITQSSYFMAKSLQRIHSDSVLFCYFFLHWIRICDIHSTLFILFSVEFSLVFSSLHIYNLAIVN